MIRKLFIPSMFVVTLLLTSCYSYTSVVGNGAQGTQEVTERNNYVIGGLVPLKVSNSKEMANGATDYTVRTRQTFGNGFVSGLTLGIYTPTTTTVTK